VRVVEGVETLLIELVIEIDLEGSLYPIPIGLIRRNDIFEARLEVLIYVSIRFDLSKAFSGLTPLSDLLERYYLTFSEGDLA